MFQRAPVPTTLLHACAEIERWRRECSEERAKNTIGGMIPTYYAKHLQNIDIIKTRTLNPATTQGVRRAWSRRLVGEKIPLESAAQIM